jgi:hypothetical protein
LQIVELLGEPSKVPNPVPIIVMKRADVQFVDDRILVPQGIVVEHEDVFMMAHAALLVRAEEHTRVLTENITGIAPFIDDLIASVGGVAELLSPCQMGRPNLERGRPPAAGGALMRKSPERVADLPPIAPARAGQAPCAWVA